MYRNEHQQKKTNIKACFYIGFATVSYPCTTSSSKGCRNDTLRQSAKRKHTEAFPGIIPWRILISIRIRRWWNLACFIIPFSLPLERTWISRHCEGIIQSDPFSWSRTMVVVTLQKIYRMKHARIRNSYGWIKQDTFLFLSFPWRKRMTTTNPYHG